MNDKRYQWILYIIIAVIAITIGIQVFWNYKNYQTNKQQLINDVQISLDKAVDDYYAALAERTTLNFSLINNYTVDSLNPETEISKLLKKIDHPSKGLKSIDSLKTNNYKSFTFIDTREADSAVFSYHTDHQTINEDSFRLRVGNYKFIDSISPSSFELLTSKVVVAISNDSLDLKKVDSLMKIEFERKNINIQHKLYFDKNLPNKNFEPIIHTARDSVLKHMDILSTTSKSTFLPKGSSLRLYFFNSTSTILKRSLTGILISTILVIAVISCLFYLLRIIKHQKQLAEVKNDLISNITHEFKTPIATIGVALESINNFNAIEDKEKTKKYIKMSSEQLGKLNLMVEKLLETATLDSDNLELNKESIDCVELLNSLVSRYKIQYPEKTFNTSFKVESLKASVDVFHFENALNNVLDNAVKYGGELISIDLVPKKDMFDILISDNGNTLSKENRERIFEKFYRVPKGNTHDVKGFGIGLYYTKTIIEKHNGSISLDLNKNLTTFKITLPNG
ncbi:sensor histidine kinase [Winogradskyella sp. MIT101101]|uniref:sensor histidine kinase n=1 Tax=Winogradskyella sp. MIT101101 TaxID=3098297 RepID=UPI00399B39A2